MDPDDVRVVILPAGRHGSSCNYYCSATFARCGRKMYRRRSGNESVQIENRRRGGLEEEARLGKFLDETCQRAYPEETSIHSFGLCGFTRLPTLRPARVYLRCPARPPPPPLALGPGLHSLRKVTSKSFPRLFYPETVYILFHSDKSLTFIDISFAYSTWSTKLD